MFVGPKVLDFTIVFKWIFETLQETLKLQQIQKIIMQDIKLIQDHNPENFQVRIIFCENRKFAEKMTD